MANKWNERRRLKRGESIKDVMASDSIPWRRSTNKPTLPPLVKEDVVAVLRDRGYDEDDIKEIVDQWPWEGGNRVTQIQFVVVDSQEYIVTDWEQPLG